MTGKTLSTILGISLALAVGTGVLSAQDAGQGQPSVAEAARKARAEKKPGGSTSKVLTNDDLGQLKDPISVVGQTANAPATAKDNNAPVAAGDKGKATAGSDSDAKEVRDENYWRRAFDEARKKLADDSKEADILQREFNLKQQQYYSDPNQALREQNSRGDLENTQKTIDAKKADVDRDNQTISDLTDDLRKSGGDPGWANPLPTQQ